MELTKHGHACLVLQKGNESLVIDPGSLTAPFSVDGLVGIVITHEHADHWTPEHLTQLRAAAPDVPIFGPAGVAAAAGDIPIDVVGAGDTRQAGQFALEFFGGTHAVIHSSIPTVDNVGVFVDDRLYYPGDSFTVPGKTVEVLAVPAGAPWLKIGEVIDFVLEVAPRRTFATHDMTNSEFGQGMANARMQWAVEQGGGTHDIVVPGSTLTI